MLLEEEKQLSKQVRTYWTNFAYSGDPNVGRNDSTPYPVQLIEWPAHVQASNLTLQLDVPLERIQNLKEVRCDVWDQVGPIHPP